MGCLRGTRKALLYMSMVPFPTLFLMSTAVSLTLKPFVLRSSAVTKKLPAAAFTRMLKDLCVYVQKHVD